MKVKKWFNAFLTYNYQKINDKMHLKTQKGNFFLFKKLRKIYRSAFKSAIRLEARDWLRKLK